MNQTIEYLQSDFTAEKGIEIGVLVNHILHAHQRREHFLDGQQSRLVSTPASV